MLSSRLPERRHGLQSLMVGTAMADASKRSALDEGGASCVATPELVSREGQGT